MSAPEMTTAMAKLPGGALIEVPAVGEFAIVIDPDTYPMLAQYPFPTLAAVAEFENEYLTKRPHKVFLLCEVTE